MRRSRTKRGQTLVEFAMILPLLLAIIMGIIDFSYIVYSWAEIHFAARRGAEQASKFPPNDVTQRKLNNPASGDECAFSLIRREVYRNGAFSAATGLSDDEVTITFYKRNSNDGTHPDGKFSTPIAAADRKLGTLIEVSINHSIVPLTPLGTQFFGSSIEMNAASRRSITSLASALATCP